jgi:hypothetical protein
MWKEHSEIMILVAVKKGVHSSYEICVTICEGEDGTELSDGDVLIFPDMIRYQIFVIFIK